MFRLLVLCLVLISGAVLIASAQGTTTKVAPAAVPTTYTLELPSVQARQMVCTATAAANPRTATCGEEVIYTCPATEVRFRVRQNAPAKTCSISCSPVRSSVSASMACSCTLKESDCR